VKVIPSAQFIRVLHRPGMKAATIREMEERLPGRTPLNAGGGRYFTAVNQLNSLALIAGCLSSVTYAASVATPQHPRGGSATHGFHSRPQLARNGTPHWHSPTSAFEQLGAALLPSFIVATGASLATVRRLYQIIIDQLIKTSVALSPPSAVCNVLASVVRI